MDAAKYLKEKKRMCDYADGKCGVDCPMDSCKGCGSIELIDPEEAVRMVEEWSKEHPIITNAMKFEEVFGVPPIGCFGAYLSLPTGRKTDCKDCLYSTGGDGVERYCIGWWDEPYKGGE